MTPVVVALALGAAITHASWNAVLRTGHDRLLTISVMSGAMALVAIPCCLLLPLPTAGVWPYLAVSSVLQVGYSLFLVAAYRHGELSTVYPVIRGTVPLLVTAGGFAFAGQRPSPLAAAGVLLVAVGIMSLALRGRRPPGSSMALAVSTGCVIAAYNVVDARAVTTTGHPLTYAAWICLVYGSLLALTFLAVRRPQPQDLYSRDIATAALGGLLSLVAYVAVICAFALGPAGPVTALRETSVIFAALIGHQFLHEKLTPGRAIACLTVVAGVVCLT